LGDTVTIDDDGGGGGGDDDSVKVIVWMSLSLSAPSDDDIPRTVRFFFFSVWDGFFCGYLFFLFFQGKLVFFLFVYFILYFEKTKT